MRGFCSLCVCVCVLSFPKDEKSARVFFFKPKTEKKPPEYLHLLYEYERDQSRFNIPKGAPFKE